MTEKKADEGGTDQLEEQGRDSRVYKRVGLG